MNDYKMSISVSLVDGPPYVLDASTLRTPGDLTNVKSVSELVLAIVTNNAWMLADASQTAHEVHIRSVNIAAIQIYEGPYKRVWSDGDDIAVHMLNGQFTYAPIGTPFASNGGDFIKYEKKDGSWMIIRMDAITTLMK